MARFRSDGSSRLRRRHAEGLTQPRETFARSCEHHRSVSIGRFRSLLPRLCPADGFRSTAAPTPIRYGFRSTVR
eukprot:15445706-Alexandrium_andersonii.AAC.1